MFDERSPVWIKIFKFFVILSAVMILAGGFFLAVEEAYDMVEFVLYFGVAAVVAVVDMSGGMLVVNFLNNVQVIREKLEEKL